MLYIVKSFGDELPAACQNTCEQSWAIFDALLVRYGTHYDITERVARVLRHGIKLFGSSAASIAPTVLGRMSIAFETTGFASYLWIAGRIVQMFGARPNPILEAGFRDLVDRSSAKVLTLLQERSPRDIPDGKYQTVFSAPYLLLMIDVQ